MAMSINPGEVLKFIRNKEFTFLRNIGQGGTGKTVLVRDEITEMDFVCKKYSPCKSSDRAQYFQRFIDEIKLMHMLHHKNIVRIYNYYLYPENTTGYILMEYIDGSSIDNYLLFQGSDAFENVFIQLIEGFEYLEKNKVLHRDIRTANILVTNDGIVKIIDFGFGKKIDNHNEEDASILLNWPVTDFPDEIKDCQYSHQTEIYFLGKLFDKLLIYYGIDDFRYQYIIDKMIVSNPNKRISSFSEVLQFISEDIFEESDFTLEEKTIYVEFSNYLVSHLIEIRNELVLIKDPREVIRQLENTLNNCLAEKFLQNNNELISCFIKSAYTYSTFNDIEVKAIRNFYRMFKKFPAIKQRIILNNIGARFKKVKVTNEDDELPF